MPGVKVLLWFDVEDYITPQADDALSGLLDMLDKKGIRGTFKLVGQKARVLMERKRTDIIAKLSHHDIGFHTDTHSQHPTVSEYLEYEDFNGGVSLFHEKESRGFEDVKKITGAPHISCYGQPGASWAPQVYPVLRKWNIPVYLDDHKIISLDQKPFWFGGILNFTKLYSVVRMELHENGLEEAKARFDKIYQRSMEETTGFISIYYHPCEFAVKEFWDGCNYARGENTPPEKWRIPSLRTRKEMEYYIDQLEAFLDYIASKKEIDFIAASALPGMEISCKHIFSPSDIVNMANKVGKDVYFQTGANWSLSASEIFSLFYQYLMDQPIHPIAFYGPNGEVSSEYTGTAKVSEVKKAIDLQYPNIFCYKQLPEAFLLHGKAVNPVDMVCTLAEIIRRGLHDQDEVEIIKGVLKSQAHVTEDEDWGKGWVIFTEDFKVPHIIEMAKLQSWTLKPALF